MQTVFKSCFTFLVYSEVTSSCASVENYNKIINALIKFNVEKSTLENERGQNIKI